MADVKKGVAVVRVEGLAGLEALLNSTEGKVQSWQRVGEGATFIVVIEGVAPTYPVEPVPVPEPVAAEAAEEKEEGNGRRRKSA